MNAPNKPEPPDGGNRDGANIAALIFIAILVVGAVWLFNTLNAANQTMNCVASGRTNCADLAHPGAASL
jgi:hypothetical protein